jgi:hypothetical protein
MMRIAIFPAHDESAASARIRSFTLQRSLAAMGHDARLRDSEGADVLFVQKRATSNTLTLVREARQQGSLVLYDVDDLGRDLWYHIAPSVLHRLLPMVDVVTTDTSEHRDLLLRDYGVPSVEIIPDTIDYYPTGPVRLPLTDTSPLRVLWFGNVANISLFEKYAHTLASMAGVQTVAVTNARAIERLSAHWPAVDFVPWSRNEFVSVLQSCALTVLPHDGTEADRAKSNNRMIASITWGVPAIVSRTPDYVRTAQEAGVEYALFNDESELIAAVERLRTASARLAYLDAAQSEVWRRYSPAAVAMRFLEVVQSAKRQNAISPDGYLRWLRRASRGRVASALMLEAMHIASRLRRRGAENAS